ncbi:cofactor assembly of complex C subunit B [Candidatus Synechococcus calcipolaris G9]|uniref:Cofactor assembly of complex C subunit B n=1 Tax=Candidatus Synechococcus calcipolaris G9 TaxID=1497997 RepID=A0ABT6EXE1_9SYNE|nr:cofactor assembly of complex C subunit B [Candidatus Synechococcus calcipolaris]MDG2990433.1 cofactor assembly of complex C subunit B [Candidatus Synechococcus calcipolaris G9]
MDPSFVFSSTVFLTLLLGIGLFFFVRASTKERIEVRQFVIDEKAEVLLPRIQSYFRDRAYQVISVNPDNQRVTLEGMVAASLFLAVLLTLLAIAGLACLALVFAFLWPNTGPFWFLLVAIAPVAPWFYWQGAQRKEQVILEVAVDSPSNATILKVTGHRDELLSLAKTLEPEG